MEICPAGISEINLGIKKGLNLGKPLPVAKPEDSLKKVSIPPIPEPQITPALSEFIELTSNSEDFIASSATTNAY